MKQLSNSYEYREQISYMPFGGVKDRQYCTGNAILDARLKYIGKQMDYEMNLADHGVRKYDNTLGQFSSIDPMWEKYYGWTPYHYCRNNPLSFVDPSGFAKYLNDQGEEVFNDEDPNNNNEYYTNSTKKELQTVLDNNGYYGMNDYRKLQRPNEATRKNMDELMSKAEQINNLFEWVLIEALGGVSESRQGDENSANFQPLIDKLKQNDGDNKVPWIFFHTHKKEKQYVIDGQTVNNKPSGDDYTIESQLMKNYPSKPNSIVYDPNSGNLMYYNTEGKATFTISKGAFLK